ncbi:MAG: hypothetical protein ACI4PT_08400, partial [Candidatus Avoscillospira sp.]
MLRFVGTSGASVTFSTSSDRPSGGHLPLKGKAFEALPRQCDKFQFPLLLKSPRKNPPRGRR